VQVVIDGSPITINPSDSIGSGGEADIYLLPSAVALKVYKRSYHADYQGNLVEQRMAEERLKEHQLKLPSFPRGLPQTVVVPEKLVMDRKGLIIGYTMKYIQGAEPLMRYSEKSFRQGKIPNQEVVSIFLDLHTTVSGIHARQVVIGDFNDLNVLVKSRAALIIDADSFQFDRFHCRLYTDRFVDPLLCDPREPRLVLARPYNPNSDWYSFIVMLFRSLLYVDPYGGIYDPKVRAKRIPDSARPLHRITIFNPDVRYPKPATHFSVLPDDLLQQMQLVLEEDERGVFPKKLLEGLRWTVCTNCGTEHARGVCPTCALVTAPVVKAVTKVRGKVVATRIFQTKGHILFAAMQSKGLHWLYHEDGKFLRETNQPILEGALDPQVRYRIKGNATLLGKGNTLIILTKGEATERLVVEAFGNLPMFDANGSHHYWIAGGQLLRDGQFGPVYIGDVLSKQTLFWVGENFGFGFYRAGGLSRSFVFDAEKAGINDSVVLDPPIRGQLVDSTCVFSSDRCFFIISTQESGRMINRCYLISQKGEVLATAETGLGDPSWLGTVRGKAAYKHFLFAATDDGIVRVEQNGNRIEVATTFPDTEPFVDSGGHLFMKEQELYVVSSKEIVELKLG